MVQRAGQAQQVRLLGVQGAAGLDIVRSGDLVAELEEQRLPVDESGWRPGHVTQAPLLDGATSWLECRVEAVTHLEGQVIVVGAVTGQARPDPAVSVLLRLDGR
jgi:flavin reductase (DIM6/NTAB) family NADH-FMN oxidoreductase RutF